MNIHVVSLLVQYDGETVLSAFHDFNEAVKYVEDYMDSDVVYKEQLIIRTFLNGEKVDSIVFEKQPMF